MKPNPLIDALEGMLSDWQDQFGEDACDCRPEPENAGHCCNVCRAKIALRMAKEEPMDPYVKMLRIIHEAWMELKPDEAHTPHGRRVLWMMQSMPRCYVVRGPSDRWNVNCNGLPVFADGWCDEAKARLWVERHNNEVPVVCWDSMTGNWEELR